MSEGCVAAVLVEKRSDGTVRQRWGLKPHRVCCIGRMPDKADLIIPHASMSRIHASLSPSEKGDYVTLKDLQSANGTYVNGVRIAEPCNIYLRSGEGNCSEITFAQNPCKYFVELPTTRTTQPSSTAVANCQQSVSSKVEISESSAVSQQKGGEQKGGEQKGGEQKRGEQKGGEQKRGEQKGGEQADGKRFVSKWETSRAATTGESSRKAQVVAAAAAKAAVYKLHEKTDAGDRETSSAIQKKRLRLWGTENGDKSDDTGVGGVGTYHASFAENKAKRAKFLKLLGDTVPCEDSEQAAGEVLAPAAVSKQLQKKTEDMSNDLEMQFIKGLRRKDGRKDGLGT